MIYEVLIQLGMTIGVPIVTYWLIKSAIKFIDNGMRPK